MSNELTPEERQALDAAGGSPARVGAGGAVQVLLPWDDFEWLRANVPGVPDVSPRIDARTGRSYALLPLADYERVKPLFEEDPITPQERRRQLRAFGRRAGWDDPEMDVYEELRNPS
jgi:hypothetical protein